MNPYNIEIFTPELIYKSSMQIQQIEYKFDYISLSNSKLKVPQIEAGERDIIRISGNGENLCGIITGCDVKEGYKEIRYKSFMDILDMDIYTDRKTISQMSFEKWLAQCITNTFVLNDDSAQNVKGLAVTHTDLVNGAVISAETNIINLYEMAVEALENYEVAISFEVDVQNKMIAAKVEKIQPDSTTIEADFPNIINKEFTIKHKKDYVNKIMIVNQEKESQQAVFYMLHDGSITQDKNSTARILPVVFTTEYISYKDNADESFLDKAMERARARLKTEKWDNCIKLEVKTDDTLVKPWEMKIGKQVDIIHEGKTYRTILTGKEITDTTTLIFGCVRTELTKILKRR